MKHTATITHIAGFFALLLLHCSVAVGSDLDPVWRGVSRYVFDETHAAFRKSSGREARLGEAVTLLNLQPRTSGNTDRAANLLNALSADAPDEIGICARYMMARLEEVHRPEPRLTEAAQRYRELRESAADHPLGQQAAVRLSLLTLYSLFPGATPTERIRMAEELGNKLTDPAAVRDHALLLGSACLYFDLPLERTQYFLEKALNAGILNLTNRADLLITLGEIARELGDHTRANAMYRRYLEENPRADRSAAVRKRLKEIEYSPSSP